VVAGTRITVELILEKLAAGESLEQVISEHPRLTAEGIRAAMAFAAEALRADIVYQRDTRVEMPVVFAEIGALITRDPALRGGRPIIAGTGICVRTIAVESHGG
jgi:uncharacterized protein (DUF433 family)